MIDTQLSSVLEVKSLCYQYSNMASLFTGRYKNQPLILDNISFDLKTGDRLGLLGANGSGKTTLLKLIAGVLKPTQGTLSFDQNISFMLLALGTGFNHFLTGRDNAILNLMIQGYSRKVAKAKAEEVKTFSGLKRYFEEPVRTYSSGMRSKLGFATAVMADVDVLLIDEILSVGDMAFRKKAEQTLLAKMNENKASVFVSHNPSKIRKVCNRVIWLEEGQIMEDTYQVARAIKAYKAYQEENQDK